MEVFKKVTYNQGKMKLHTKIQTYKFYLFQLNHSKAILKLTINTKELIKSVKKSINVNKTHTFQFLNVSLNTNVL